MAKKGRHIDSAQKSLFDRELGITPARSLTVDVLHAFYLGVLNAWAKETIWELILSGCYGSLDGTKEESAHIAILILRDLLMLFYKRYAAEHKDDPITRVADLTVKMLGTTTNQKLKTKGAETWGVALFLISELPGRMAMLGEEGARLLEAGKELENMVRIWKENDWTMPRSAAKESTCISYIRLSWNLRLQIVSPLLYSNAGSIRGQRFQGSKMWIGMCSLRKHLIATYAI